MFSFAQLRRPYVLAAVDAFLLPLLLNSGELNPVMKLLSCLFEALKELMCMPFCGGCLLLGLDDDLFFGFDLKLK